MNEDLILDTKTVETSEEITQEVQKNENLSQEEKTNIANNNLEEIIKKIFAEKTASELEQLQINKEKADKLDRQEKAKELGVDLNALEETEINVKAILEAKDPTMEYIKQHYDRQEEQKMIEAQKDAERRTRLVVSHGENYYKIYKPRIQEDLNKIFGADVIEDLEKNLPKSIYSNLVDKYISKSLQYKEGLSSIVQEEKMMTKAEWVQSIINKK